jgi:hypothetical protein
MAQLFGLDAHTVTRGRRELFESGIELERVRKISSLSTSMGQEKNSRMKTILSSVLTRIKEN